MINYVVLYEKLREKFLRDSPSLFLLRIDHSGLKFTSIPPHIESLLMSSISKKLKLYIVDKPAIIPVKMGVVKGYKLFLSSSPLVLADNKIIAKYKNMFAEIYFDEKDKVLKAKPTDKPFTGSIGRELVRGNFYRSVIRVFEETGRHVKYMKINGNWFEVGVDRGVLKNEVTYYATIYNPLVYVGYGFPFYIQYFLPDGFGRKRSATILDVYVEDMDIDDMKPWIPLFAVLPNGDYLLLKHTPRDIFSDSEIVYDIPAMMRTIPPYYNHRNMVEVLLPGSVVNSIPEVEFYEVK